MSGVQGIGAIKTNSPGGIPPSVRDRSKGRWMLQPFVFSALVGVVTALAVVTICVVTGSVYHLYGYGDVGPVHSYIAIGSLIAFLYVLPFAFRSEFSLDRFLARPPQPGRIMLIWTWSFFALAVVAFLTKSTATFSRGWLVLFYLTGGGLMIGLEVAIRALAQRALVAGRIARRRLMLIGTPEDIQRFNETHARTRSLVETVCVFAVPPALVGAEDAAADFKRDVLLTRAVISARAHDVESVVLLTDWTHATFVDACVNAFSMVPVSIHLDAGRLADRFGTVRIDRVGPVAALALTEPPMGTLQLAAKRAFDIAVSAAALFALGGLFLAVAILIKRDSPGPVFFRQRRLGYNQREFMIYKFRSMAVQDEGGRFQQTSRNDPRVTRVGRFLRRFNIDELPQLINVLKGEMSIVGPRPHAVAHDRMFEKRIEMYPRRLNVRPGITGWAQVHGHRGETDTDAKMAARVEHDLYYIDNWSLGLDLYIMLLTVVSPKAYRNAF